VASILNMASDVGIPGAVDPRSPRETIPRVEVPTPIVLAPRPGLEDRLSSAAPLSPAAVSTQPMSASSRDEGAEWDCIYASEFERLQANQHVQNLKAKVQELAVLNLVLAAIFTVTLITMIFTVQRPSWESVERELPFVLLPMLGELFAVHLAWEGVASNNAPLICGVGSLRLYQVISVVFFLSHLLYILRDVFTRDFLSVSAATLETLPP